jgi:hemoglobin
VRVLVVGRADVGPLSRHANGKHMPLPVDADHFDRWLALFEATALEICPPAAATHFVELARRIAASLELGIAGAQGIMLGNGERFRRREDQAAGDIR